MAEARPISFSVNSLSSEQRSIDMVKGMIGGKNMVLQSDEKDWSQLSIKSDCFGNDVMGGMIWSERAEYDISRHPDALMVVRSDAALAGTQLPKSEIYTTGIFAHCGA
jgi:hypothetical protein